MDKILLKINLEKIVFIILLAVIGFSSAYVINSVLEEKFFTLPKVATEHKKIFSNTTDTKKDYKFLDYVFKTTEKETIGADGKNEKTEVKPIKSTSNLKLRGIVSTGTKKLALLEMNKNLKFAEENDNIFGYKVKKIEDYYVIVEKNGTEYMVSMKFGKGSIKSTKHQKKFSQENVQTDESEVIKIDRRFIEEKTADIGTLLKDVLIVPEIKNNETIGFRFRYVRPQSLLYKYGLRSGDLIVSINDMPVRTAEEAFRIYNMLRNEKIVRVVIERKGKRKVITYEIR
ncbi:type II secretion system protein GspC [Persephonella sp.]